MGVGVDVGLESRTALVLHRPHAQLGIDRVGIDRTAGRICTHLGLLCADTSQRAYHQSVRAKATRGSKSLPHNHAEEAQSQLGRRFEWVIAGDDSAAEMRVWQVRLA
ncbi:hypothetical protein L1887_50588 [Cichorium endivia]|nr:hypothetical protein L1887_50588 [Cichorium endivia]